MTIGNRTRVRVVKNKVAAPFKSAEFDILFDEGIDRTGELIDQGLNTGLLQKTGTWISYGPDRLGQGREQSRQTLKGNPDLAQAPRARDPRRRRARVRRRPAGNGKGGDAKASRGDGRREGRARRPDADEGRGRPVRRARRLPPAGKREPVGEVRETPPSRRAPQPRD